VMRGQRQYVSGNAVWSAARRDGLRNMQEYYGDQLAERIRERVRARRDLHHAIADAGRLSVLYPRGLFVHAWRKLLGLAGYGREREPADPGGVLGSEAEGTRQSR